MITFLLKKMRAQVYAIEILISLCVQSVIPIDLCVLFVICKMVLISITIGFVVVDWAVDLFLRYCLRVISIRCILHSLCRFLLWLWIYMCVEMLTTACTFSNSTCPCFSKIPRFLQEYILGHTHLGCCFVTLFFL
jgi:hypothetical protein